MEAAFTIQNIIQSLAWTSPLLVIIFAALAVLVADVFLAHDRRWLLAPITMGGIVLALITLYLVTPPLSKEYTMASMFEAMPAFAGVLTQNKLVFIAHNVILGGALFLVLIMPPYIEERKLPHGEFYAVFLFAVMAMMALAASTELLTLFINIEMLSICLYVLTGIEKRNARSSEAAFKYFLLGSIAASFLLLGIAFVFGATGELRYDRIAAVLAGGRILDPIFLTAGLVLMLVGFGFKLTLAPFHMYAPDVYEGAPTPIASTIATISKVAGLSAFAHLVFVVAQWTEPARGVWVALYAIVAISMVIGNIGAIIQPNIKRMLAYSSIAHSGYTAIPFVVVLMRPDLMPAAFDAVCYYLIAYTLMTLLAFGVAGSLGQRLEGPIEQYAGLYRRSPLLAVAMAIAMLSLLGMPPTVGFLGKLQLFSVAVAGDHLWLAVLGVLASVASAYYYLRVIVVMFMREPGIEVTERPLVLDGRNYVALSICAIFVFFLALMPLY